MERHQALRGGARLTPHEIQKRLEAHRKRAESYQDKQRLLLRYGYDCFFRRLIISPYKTKLVLKGAMLLTTLELQGIRNTKDADFQMDGRHDEPSIAKIFTEILNNEVDDAISFNLKSLTVIGSGKDRAYPGYVVRLRAAVGQAPLTLQFDLGFGEVITPGVTVIHLPALADFPPLKIRAYPWETVVAEKLEAIVKLGMRNNRMKDFYDLFTLADLLTFQSDSLSSAITNTFAHRKTPLPTRVPIGLTQSFFKDKAKIKDWKAFLNRHNLPNRVGLEDCCQAIERFVMPLLDSPATNSRWNAIWAEKKWTEGGQS